MLVKVELAIGWRALKADKPAMQRRDDRGPGTESSSADLVLASLSEKYRLAVGGTVPRSKH